MASQADAHNDPAISLVQTVEVGERAAGEDGDQANRSDHTSSTLQSIDLATLQVTADEDDEPANTLHGASSIVNPVDPAMPQVTTVEDGEANSISDHVSSITNPVEPSIQDVTTTEHAHGLDIDSSDADSATADLDLPASTSSLRSSVFEYIEENGRTYHRYKSGHYMLPNDDLEQERLDLQHQLWMVTLDGALTLAPISSPQRVLDIGTGTGIWAIEFAKQNPSAHVIGTDLSPIQPLYVPPNCTFEVDDAEDDWTYSQKFDYIHGRLLFSCFNDMAGVVRKAYDELEPGGYLEMQEINCRLHGVDDTTKGTAIQRWTDLIIEGAARFGKDWECGARLKEFFFAAGFEEVVELHYAFPTNMWPKSRHKKLVGLYQMTNMLDGMQGISTRVLTKGLGMSIEEMELFLVDVREALQNRHIHGYWPVMVVYGRKPR